MLNELFLGQLEDAESSSLSEREGAKSRRKANRN